MQRKSSPRPILLAAALLLGFILLAAGLDGFQLASGLRIESNFAQTIERAFEYRDREARNYYDGNLLGWIVSITVGLSIVLFFVGLIRRENRLSTLFLLVLGAVVVLLVTRIPPPQAPLDTPFEEGGSLPGSGDEAISLGDTLDEEDAVDVDVERPEGTSLLSWILAVAALGGLVVVVRPHLPAFGKTAPPENTMELAAQEALRTAERGDDVLETVVRCYRDMLRIYRKTHFAGRHNTLTPREFTARLVAAGVPAAHAQGLTTLFERARYGTITLSAQQERDALDHLRVIADALQAGDARFRDDGAARG